jgi:hypothetical protein
MRLTSHGRVIDFGNLRTLMKIKIKIPINGKPFSG